MKIKFYNYFKHIEYLKYPTYLKYDDDVLHAKPDNIDIYVCET